MTTYEQILKEHDKLQEKINYFQNKLASFPDGKLICSHNANHYKWYHSDGHTKSYIPKSQRQFAEQLAIKKYLSLLLEDLYQEQKAFNYYLKHCSPQNKKAEHLLTDISGFQELLTPYFKPISQELSDWMHSSYDQNPNHPENLIHKTLSGNLVRSKSEALIDLFLSTNQIPFRYECALRLGDMTIFPDYTIRHPKTGDTYYWEHLGRMDDPVYSKNAYSKLQLYTLNGIYPSIQLITTYETQNNPLNAETIEKIIEHYFL